MANIGDRVKYIINGFTGIVTSHTTFLNGCVRLGVAPEVLNSDGTPIKSSVFDVQQLEVLATGVVKPSASKKYKIKLGDRVRSKINGYQGLVTAWTTFIGGNVTLGVTAETLNKDGKPFDEESFVADDLELVMPLEVPLSAKEKERKVKSPGGPRPESAFERKLASE